MTRLDINQVLARITTEEIPELNKVTSGPFAQVSDMRIEFEPFDATALAQHLGLYPDLVRTDVASYHATGGNWPQPGPPIWGPKPVARPAPKPYRKSPLAGWAVLQYCSICRAHRHTHSLGLKTDDIDWRGENQPVADWIARWYEEFECTRGHRFRVPTESPAPQQSAPGTQVSSFPPVPGAVYPVPGGF